MRDWFQRLKPWQRAFVAQEFVAYSGLAAFLIYNTFTGNWALMPNAAIMLVWFLTIAVLDRIATAGFLDENPHLRKHINNSWWTEKTLLTMQEVLIWRGIKWLVDRIQNRSSATR